MTFYLRPTIILILMFALGACQNLPADKSGGFYVYTDAQGNVITLEKEPPKTASAEPADSGITPPSIPQATPRSGNDTGAANKTDDWEDYRPSTDVDKELQAKENQRFMTYLDETGQLVSRPLDMGAERQAARNKTPNYSDVGKAEYLESYRALRQDCCRHFLDQAVVLKAGKEVLVKFDSDSPLIKAAEPLRAMIIEPGGQVEQIQLMAFIRKQQYVGAQLLWLDSNGNPVLLIEQPFSRRYPENWHRYGYLQGTLEREKEHHYLVVFLPYSQARAGADGLEWVIDGELVLAAP